MANNRKWLGKKGEGYVIIQFVLFGLIFVAPFLTRSYNNWPFPWQTLGLTAGLVLMGCGLILAFWGLLSLGDNLTAVPHPKENARMVENGAYRLVRHPIYSGIILGALGWSLFMTSGLSLLLVLVLFLFFDAKSRQEEKWLAEKYENYPAYQTRVKKLIPFIY